MREGACDVDVLIGAGVIGTGKRMSFGLSLARMREAGGLSDVHRVADDLANMLAARCARRGERAGSGAKQLALVALLTWLDPTCSACNGHGHPAVEGAPVLNEAVDCQECHGTGRSAHAKGLTRRHVDMVDWMIAEMESASSDAMGLVAGYVRG